MLVTENPYASSVTTERAFSPSENKDQASTLLLWLSSACWFSAITLPVFSIVALPLTAVISLVGTVAAFLLLKRARQHGRRIAISLALIILNGLVAVIAFGCVLISFYFWSTFEGPG